MVHTMASKAHLEATRFPMETDGTFSLPKIPIEDRLPVVEALIQTQLSEGKHANMHRDLKGLANQ